MVRVNSVRPRNKVLEPADGQDFRVVSVVIVCCFSPVVISTAIQLSNLRPASWK